LYSGSDEHDYYSVAFASSSGSAGAGAGADAVSFVVCGNPTCVDSNVSGCDGEDKP